MGGAVAVAESAPTPEVTTFSTLDVAPGHRLGTWQDHNVENLIGIRPATHAEEGLVATMSSLALVNVHLTEISGNAHVIDRSRYNTKQLPEDAIFISFMLEGEAFFYHGAGTEILRGGEAIMYDADQPFLFGFPRGMREVILEIPRGTFLQVTGTERPAKPTVFTHRGVGPQTQRAGSLARLVQSAIAEPSPDTAAEIESSALDLLQLVTGGPGVHHTAAYLLAAKDYIHRHLQDHNLSATTVARAIGVSERHLNRVFASDGTTLARYILAERLERAHAELVSRTPDRIADVAARWTFASQAHFARVFKDRFGFTPTQAREAP